METFYGDYGTIITYSKTPKNSKACISIRKNGHIIDISIKDILKIITSNGILDEIFKTE